MHKGQFTKEHTLGFKKGRIPWNKGGVFTEETKKKMREARKKFYANGGIHPRKGIRHTQESINKIKVKRALQVMPSGFSRPDMKGENNFFYGKNKSGKDAKNWKGGITRQKGYYAFIEKQREIKKKLNGGSHTFGEWQTLKAQYNFTCVWCKRSEPQIKLTQDHIISLKNGGSNNIENIQPLCVSCNSKKGIKNIKFV